jgi:hypothetical protein
MHFYKITRAEFHQNHDIHYQPQTGIICDRWFQKKQRTCKEDKTGIPGNILKGNLFVYFYH